MIDGKTKQTKETKNRLFQALISLMENKSYEEIKIKDVLDLSGVSRRTFYRHFANKNELLNHYFKQIINRYLTERKYFTETDNFEGMLAESMNFWYQERETLHILIKHQHYDFFFHQFNEHAKEVYMNITLLWFAYSGKIDTQNYVVSFTIGGYYNTLRNWLMQENPEEPKKIAHGIQQMIIKLTDFFDLDETNNIDNL
ncbi:TetR/AcrR family transcriptional regulator [Streptococcus macedonicus]|uniref:TetR/AcrR family transcriptional regulator n=1 Tax=Streptococcus macedonicus TaxID=59310 RepID=UPI0022E55017|nr:TetR/AcrR family transcriptional regulator [Streptococcus macedonicus]